MLTISKMHNWVSLAIVLLVMLTASCGKQGDSKSSWDTSISDLAKLDSNERARAQANWVECEKAFKNGDAQALSNLIGRKVQICFDASGSPWTGKAISLASREARDKDLQRLVRKTGEAASQISREIQQRMDNGWQVACRVDFTKKQVREHFIWPDAVFSSQFDVYGTFVSASLSSRSICVKPAAIPAPIVQL